jgi:hypothetical protein
MSFYTLDKQSNLRDYYRVFLVVWPPLFFVPFFVLLELVFRVSRSMFIGVYLLCTGLAVGVGAPLFCWARKRLEFTKDPRPVLLACGLTVLSGTAPLAYFLIRPLGFDPLAALVAGSVVVLPWVILYLSPPTKLYERLRTRASVPSRRTGTDT